MKITEKISHCIPHVVEARAQYSASNDERETVSCFFGFHKIKEFPRKKQYPVIGFRKSTQVA